MSDELKNKIIEQVKLAQEGKANFVQIHNDDTDHGLENQFIFFVKPELTLKSDTINFEKVLDTVFEKLSGFEFKINDVRLLGADYLQKNNIVAQHYGVINKISTNALENMTQGAKDNLKKLSGSDSLDNVKVMGAYQFLEAYPMFNESSLDILWQNNSNERLAGGTYCETIKANTDTIYLLNGFHPGQITHFTEAGRSIVVFTVSSNLDWAEARQNFVGATNPAKANEGSLRKAFLDNQSALGIPEVNQGLNGVHLSAGPVEGLVELIRYNSDYSSENGSKSYNDFSFGKKLAAVFSNDEVEKIMNNENVEYNGEVISTFDLTEEKSSNESLELLKKAFNK